MVAAIQTAQSIEKIDLANFRKFMDDAGARNLTFSTKELAGAEINPGGR